MKYLITLLLLSFSFQLFAQIGQEENEKPKHFYYLKFSHNSFQLYDNNKLKIRQKTPPNYMEGLLAGNDLALHHYKAYRTLNAVKWGCRGAFLITEIVGLTQLNNTNDLGWNLITSGLVFMLAVQLPISIVAGSQAGKAVDEHNTNMKLQEEKYGFQIGITPRGIGLVMNF